MVAQFLFFFFPVCAIFPETAAEMDVKKLSMFFCKKQIANNFPWSLVLPNVEMTALLNISQCFSRGNPGPVIVPQYGSSK